MTLTNKFSLSRTSKRRGVTLVELAIALGVMGVVSAAIWATAGVVRSRQPIHETVQLVSEIAENVRGVYTGFAATAVTPVAVLGQIQAGLYPNGVVNAAGTDTFNAWGGTILVVFAAPLTGFSIVFTLPATMDVVTRREVCAAMATRLPATATDYAGGLVAGTPLPTAAPALDANQGGGPALTLLLNGGAWKNVTGLTAVSGAAATSFFGAGAAEVCSGFAVYYRL